MLFCTYHIECRRCIVKHIFIVLHNVVTIVHPCSSLIFQAVKVVLNLSQLVNLSAPTVMSHLPKHFQKTYFATRLPKTIGHNLNYSCSSGLPGCLNEIKIMKSKSTILKYRKRFWKKWKTCWYCNGSNVPTNQPTCNGGLSVNGSQIFV